MFAGLYFFYRERYVLAALIFGVGSTRMPFIIYSPCFTCPPICSFAILNALNGFLTGLAFIITSLPFLCWQIPISISREVAHPVPASEWIPLYYLSCPQNFLFADSPLKDVLSNAHIWWDKHPNTFY